MAYFIFQYLCVWALRDVGDVSTASWSHPALWSPIDSSPN